MRKYIRSEQTLRGTYVKVLYTKKICAQLSSDLIDVFFYYIFDRFLHRVGIRIGTFSAPSNMCNINRQERGGKREKRIEIALDFYFTEPKIHLRPSSLLFYVISSPQGEDFGAVNYWI